MMARWIRLRTRPSGPLGCAEALEFEDACARLAVAQTRHASPILLWSEGDAEYPFALIASLKLAPGRPMRWRAWGLAAAVAAYRQFGVPAYLDDGEMWLHGRRIAESKVKTAGECVVVASSFLMQFPSKCVATPSPELEQAFRLRLEAQHGWQFEHSWPSESEMLHYAVA
jgi:hypothetical protein